MPSRLSFQSFSHLSLTKHFSKPIATLSRGLSDAQAQFLQRKVFQLFKRDSLPDYPLHIGDNTTIIIVSSCREGETGPLNDLALLLWLVGYRHNNDHQNITLLHNFELRYKDCDGVTKTLPATSLTSVVVEMAIRNTMKNVGPCGKVLFYYGGHGSNSPPGSDIISDQDSMQCLLPSKNETINGPDLLSWLCSGADSSVMITAILDSCHSGGLLGLEFVYTYEPEEGAVTIDPLNKRREIEPLLIQISACRANEIAGSYAEDENSEPYGFLTLILAQFLTKNPNYTIEELVEYLHVRCDDVRTRTRCDVGSEEPTGYAKVECSRRLGGELHLL